MLDNASPDNPRNPRAAPPPVAVSCESSDGQNALRAIDHLSGRIEVLPADPKESIANPILYGSSNGAFYFICKRCTDLLLAGLLIVILSPLLLLIALLIKCDSSGPVFFTHKRVGARRRNRGRKSAWVVTHFGMHKFRSMFQDADPRVHESYIRDFVEGRARPDTASGGKFKLTNDPRVTRVGCLLRCTSLDELPQLFNVLKGEMSLVGPRPVPPYEVACYRNGDHKRLAALPGITGWWQVNGRCQVSFEEMVRMDIEYIQKASLWLDLRILFLTIPAVLGGRGAE